MEKENKSKLIEILNSISFSYDFDKNQIFLYNPFALKFQRVEDKHLMRFVKEMEFLLRNSTIVTPIFFEREQLKSFTEVLDKNRRKENKE